MPTPAEIPAGQAARFAGTLQGLGRMPTLQILPGPHYKTDSDPVAGKPVLHDDVADLHAVLAALDRQGVLSRLHVERGRDRTPRPGLVDASLPQALARLIVVHVRPEGVGKLRWRLDLSDEAYGHLRLFGIGGSRWPNAAVVQLL